jgi:hypothetical protein
MNTLQRRLKAGDGSVQGPLLAEFDNGTKLTELRNFFKNL